MDKAKITQLIQYRRHINEVKAKISETYNVDDYKLPTIKKISDVTKCLNVIAENTGFRVTLYFYKSRDENEKVIDNKYESTRERYHNRLSFSVKRNHVEFIKNKQIDKMYQTPKNENPTYEHKKKYYDMETLDEIENDTKHYTILLNDNEGFESQVETHKSSMQAIRDIFSKYNIDENVMKRAHYIPSNVMISLLSHLFKNYKSCDYNHELENEYLEKCYSGPLCGYKKGTYDEKFYKYDYNGYYLHLLKKLIIPVGGARKKDSYDDGDFGIYELEVEELPYFYKRDATHFTNYDIVLFNKTGIKYKIVSGIVYDQVIDCGDIKNMEILNDLYENRNDTIKNMYKKFWGVLSQMNTIKKPASELRDGDEIIKYHRSSDLYEFIPGAFQHRYMTKLFRIKQFINSYGRLVMGMKIHNLEKKGFDVIRIQTDSLITNAPKEYFKIEVGKLGKFKFEEEYENIEIVNFVKYGKK